MKRILFTSLFSLFGFSMFGQVNQTFEKHQLSIDFGSFRNRYLYPITDIRYTSPVLERLNLRFSARIRSYGTLYFYSQSAYDFTPLVEYYFLRNERPICFSTGIGVDIRARLVHDERSNAQSSAEPLVSLAMHGKFKNLMVTMPLWTRFYTNGIAFTLMPEVSYLMGKRFSVFLRYEGGLLAIYSTGPPEWRQDCFVGLTMHF